MAIPVARVHLAMAHAALPALLPTPPKWKMLPLLPTPCVATILGLPKPLAKPSRADSDERWDARKTKPASAEPSAASSSSSGPRSADSVINSKWPISRATSAERWDVHKKCCLPQAKLLDDGESSSTGSNDIDTEEEEIVWKPRAMYAGPGFVVAAPESSMLPMPTAFLVPVA